MLTATKANEISETSQSYSGPYQLKFLALSSRDFISIVDSETVNVVWCGQRQLWGMLWMKENSSFSSASWKIGNNSKGKINSFSSRLNSWSLFVFFFFFFRSQGWNVSQTCTNLTATEIRRRQRNMASWEGTRNRDGRMWQVSLFFLISGEIHILRPKTFLSRQANCVVSDCKTSAQDWSSNEPNFSHKQSTYTSQIKELKQIKCIQQHGVIARKTNCSSAAGLTSSICLSMRSDFSCLTSSGSRPNQAPRE